MGGDLRERWPLSLEGTDDGSGEGGWREREKEEAVSWQREGSLGETKTPKADKKHIWASPLLAAEGLW